MMKQITLRLKPDLMNQLLRESGEMGVSLNAYIAMCLIDRHPPGP